MSPHVHNAFINATEGIRVSVGAGYVLSYVLAGLFHAARKVRAVYWKLWNNLYIGSQDALVAVFPELPDEPRNCYWMAENNMVI